MTWQPAENASNPVTMKAFTCEIIPICNLLRLRQSDPVTGGLPHGWCTVR